MTQVELQQAVRQLYPSSIYNVDWTVVVDTSGTATLKLWNNALGPQPTDTELAAALAASQLAVAKATQTSQLLAAYQTEVYNTPVSLTVGSNTYSFPVDDATQTNITKYLSVFAKMTTPPATVPLADANGKPQQLSPADLQALAELILTQSVSAWTKLVQLQAQVAAATTIAAVQGISW
jgi:hypothetical protein